MRQLFRFFIILLAVILVSCGSALPTVKPYKMDIQQGNVLTSEMLLQLRPGMTKSQVRFILGTPLLVDSFHSNRWDYFYQLRKQGEVVNQRRVILDFEDDLLLRVRGDVVPKGQTAEDVAKQLEAEAAASKVVKPVDENNADQDSLIIEPIEKPNVEVIEPSASVAPSSESSVQTIAEPIASKSVPAPVLPVGSVAASEANMLVPQQGEKVDSASSELKNKAESVAKQSTTQVPEVEDKAVVMQESVAKEIEATAESVLPVQSGAIAVPERTVPIAPIMPTTDKNLVFRLDRQLDTRRIVQMQEKETFEKVEASVTQEPKSNEGPMTENDDPSFFERMLEKIGF